MKLLCLLFGWCVRMEPVYYEDREIIHSHKCKHCGETRYRRA